MPTRDPDDAKVDAIIEEIGDVLDRHMGDGLPCDLWLILGLNFAGTCLATARELGGEAFLRDQREKPGLLTDNPKAGAMYRAVDALLELVDLTEKDEASA